VPTGGIVNAVATGSGRITRRFINEGDKVNAGQPLYELSAERSSNTGEVDARIEEALSARRDERRRTLHVQVEELRHSAQTLEKRQVLLDREINTRQQEMALQDAQVRNAQNRTERYKRLATQGFVSHAQVDDVVSELAAQQGRYKSLEATMLTAQREIVDLQSEARAIASKIDVAESQAKQELAAIEQESAEHDGRSRFRVVAPVAGTVAAPGPQLGQFVVAGTVLAAILPAGSQLEARLLVPSRSIAFIELGQQVRMKLDAFPYQKFGHLRGTVTRVEQAPLSEPRAGAEAGGTPLYRVVVRLERQSIYAYGQERTFKAGMVVEADILQDRRRLIEWLLEPLFSVTKGLAY
jgi:membrane fusion protein